MPICSGRGILYEVSLRGRLARSPEDDARSQCKDARVKYDGINIDDACLGERVQLEIRGEGTRWRSEREREVGGKSRTCERWERKKKKESKRGEYLEVVTHVAIELSATN